MYRYHLVGNQSAILHRLDDQTINKVPKGLNFPMPEFSSISGKRSARNDKAEQLLILKPGFDSHLPVSIYFPGIC